MTAKWWNLNRLVTIRDIQEANNCNQFVCVSWWEMCCIYLPLICSFSWILLWVSLDDRNTGTSASASVLPVNIQGWSPLRLTGLISLLSRGLSGGVFSSTTIQRFFESSTQESNPGLLHCRWILYHLSHQGSLGRPYIHLIITDWIIRRTCTAEHLVI